MSSINGTSGADSLLGGIGDDTILAGDGNDTIAGGSGQDALDGGMGIDAADYTTNGTGVWVNMESGRALDISGVSYDIEAGTSTITPSNTNYSNDYLFNIERIIGSDFADYVIGYANADIIDAEGANDVVKAGAGNDTISGGSGDDILLGEGGNDLLSGGRGADTLDGGEGNDTVSYRYSDAKVFIIISTVNAPNGFASGGYATGDVLKNIENIIGSNGFGDIIFGADFDNKIEGLGGDDRIYGLNGNNQIIGGEGGDQIFTGSGSDTIYGDDINSGSKILNISYNDMIVSGAGNDLIYGGFGADNINAVTGNDTIYAGDGDDIIIGSEGHDSIDGGTGLNSLKYLKGTQAVSIDLTKGTATGGYANSSAVVTNIRDVYGTEEYDDEIIGDENANGIFSNGGNDTVIAGGGNDTIYTFLGNDVIIGGAGADFIVSGSGSDIHKYEALTDSNHDSFDTIVGFQSGIDKLDLTALAVHGITSKSMVTIDDSDPDKIIITHGSGQSDLKIELSVSSSITQSDIIYGGVFVGTSNNNITGTGGSDFLRGNNNSDVINGKAGNDIILGGQGSDSILGDEGNDYLRGAAGDDTIKGGSGSDVVDYRWENNKSVNVNLTNGTATGDAIGDDTLFSIERVYGSNHHDTITGNSDVNNLQGMAGNDLIKGEAGNDILIGGSGNDTLIGGADADTMVGGEGFDVVDYSYIANDGQIVINLSNGVVSAASGDANGDIINGVEHIIGSSYNDTILGRSDTDEKLEGGAGQDFISAYGGDDTLVGGDGFDVLLGGAGNDTIKSGDGGGYLRGGAGNDLLEGGTGFDAADYRWESSSNNASDGVYVNLVTNTARDTGSAKIIGQDTLSSIEKVYGTMQNDEIIGDNNFNILFGFAGNDTITGGQGADVINPGAGADIIKYNSLNDGNDTIIGFEVGIDKLDFSSLNLTSSDPKLVITNDVVNNSATVEYRQNTSQPEDNFKIELTNISDALQLTDIEFDF